MGGNGICQPIIIAEFESRPGRMGLSAERPVLGSVMLEVDRSDMASGNRPASALTSKRPSVKRMLKRCIIRGMQSGGIHNAGHLPKGERHYLYK